MAGRRVLLFGASGFLGSQVGAALDHDSRAGTVTRVGRPRAGQPGAGWISHDLVAAGTDELAALIRRVRPDAVINCAGRLSGDIVQLAEANVLVTARLIEAVSREAPAARLVVLGSAAEYGPTPHGLPVGEDRAANPIAAYGVTRLASTQLVRLAVSEERLDAAVLRVFSPIGPGVPPESLIGRAAASMRTALRNGEDTIVLGPLGAYRDFVDVRDVATAITAAALADQVKEPVLNVGGGRPVRCREAVHLLARIAGFSGRVVETDPPSVRSGSVDWSAADLSRIERSLGWTPGYDLRASVEASWHHGEPAPRRAGPARAHAGLTGSATTGSGSFTHAPTPPF
jgi:NDP-hexose 4-ketoreductase